MTDPLAPLRERFRDRVEIDLAQLREMVSGDLASDDLKRLAHNLAGAAGLFGHPELSKAAMAIDDRFAAGETPDLAQTELLETRMRAVIGQP